MRWQEALVGAALLQSFGLASVLCKEVHRHSKESG
jgi:hypothetical protein